MENSLSFELVPEELVPEELVPEELVPEELVPEELVPESSGTAAMATAMAIYIAQQTIGRIECPEYVLLSRLSSPYLLYCYFFSISKKHQIDEKGT